MCFILPKTLLDEAKRALVRWVRFPLLMSIDLICIFLDKPANNEASKSCRQIEFQPTSPLSVSEKYSRLVQASIISTQEYESEAINKENRLINKIH